jgi:glycerol uptake facilitator-like aquaporin
MDMPRRLGAEFLGTFWLTFVGCGSAVLAAGFPALGHWLFRDQSGVWPNSPHDGVCGR